MTMMIYEKNEKTPSNTFEEECFIQLSSAPLRHRASALFELVNESLNLFEIFPFSVHLLLLF